MVLDWFDRLLLWVADRLEGLADRLEASCALRRWPRLGRRCPRIRLKRFPRLARLLCARWWAEELRWRAQMLRLLVASFHCPGFPLAFALQYVATGYQLVDVAEYLVPVQRTSSFTRWRVRMGLALIVHSPRGEGHWVKVEPLQGVLDLCTVAILADPQDDVA